VWAHSVTEVFNARVEHLEQNLGTWFTKLNQLEAAGEERLKKIDNTLASFDTHVQEALGMFEYAAQDERKKLLEQIGKSFESIKAEAVQAVAKSLAESFKGGIMVVRNAYPHEIREGAAVVTRPATYIEIQAAAGK